MLGRATPARRRDRRTASRGRCWGSGLPFGPPWSVSRRLRADRDCVLDERNLPAKVGRRRGLRKLAKVAVHVRLVVVAADGSDLGQAGAGGDQVARAAEAQHPREALGRDAYVLAKASGQVLAAAAQLPRELADLEQPSAREKTPPRPVDVACRRVGDPERAPETEDQHDPGSERLALLCRGGSAMCEAPRATDVRREPPIRVPHDQLVGHGRTVTGKTARYLPRRARRRTWDYRCPGRRQ